MWQGSRTQHKPGGITILYKKTYSDGKLTQIWCVNTFSLF